MRSVAHCQSGVWLICPCWSCWSDITKRMSQKTSNVNIGSETHWQPFSQTAGGGCVTPLRGIVHLTVPHLGRLWQINDQTWLTACHGDSGACGPPRAPPGGRSARREVLVTRTVRECDASEFLRMISHNHFQIQLPDGGIMFSSWTRNKCRHCWGSAEPCVLSTELFRISAFIIFMLFVNLDLIKHPAILEALKSSSSHSGSS